MAKTVLEELVTVLGFEIDDDDLGDLEKSVEKVRVGMKRMIKVASGAATALGAFVTFNANAADETTKFARSIDETVDAVQRLEHAGQIMGTTANDVRSSLRNLSRIASSAARGEAGADIFGMLGLSPTTNGRVKSSVALFEEVADRINRLQTGAERAEFAQKLGISDSTVLLLQAGRDRIRELGAELESVGAILTPEQQDTAEKFMDSLVRGRAAVRGMANEIALQLAPVLGETVDDFFEWAQANRDVIKANITEWVDNLVQAMPALISTLGVLAAVLAVINGMAILWGVAIGVALLGVFEFIETLRGVEDTLTIRFFNHILEVLKNMSPPLRLLVWQFKQLFEMFEDFGGIGKIAELLSSAKDFVVNGAINLDTSSNGFGSAATGFGLAFPGLSGVAGAITTITQSPTINFHGAVEPGQVRKEVKEAMDDMGREVESDSSNPVVN